MPLHFVAAEDVIYILSTQGLDLKKKKKRQTEWGQGKISVSMARDLPLSRQGIINQA